tara:strand:+ start:248 stop:418 length:171 start_codon:yes stop_codon:yes gene_type:complete
MKEIDVKKLRLNLGLTQKELAEGLGVSRVSVNNWEGGKVKPSRLALSGLNRLANSL